MKLFYNIITMLTISFGLLTFTKLKAQNSNASSWSKKMDRQKSFIENKGQFIIPNSFGNMSDVLFAVDNGGTKIYFTKKGITYTFLETKNKQKDEREMARERREEFKDAESHERFEKEEHELKIKSDQVTMLWGNANSNVDIQATGLTSDYHNYSFKNKLGQTQDVSHVKAYQKITYKNLYPNIDVEYVFSEKDGLKYSLILHPGADPSIVKMVYDNSVTLKSNGDVHIDTKFGDIIDHAPLTFYESNKVSIITSKFLKVGKTVSFQLDNYDNTQTVVIDPWTLTPAFTTNWDCVWECEKDGAGNVYIIGGVMPLQLIKYNAAGAIQWTYNTPYDTTSWLGGFAVDNIGNAYVTNGTTPGIIKVNTAGVLQWSVGGGALVEYWEIAFNCDQTKLIVGGTDNLRGAIFDINTANGAVLATKIIAYGSAFGFPPSIQEVRAITACGNGRYYFLTLDSIGYINQNFTLCSANTAIFKTTSTHGFSYKCENFRYDNTGIMAIRADLNFVYTHNGTTLFKRSLANAAIIASVPIPGGAATTSLGQKAVSCSGIDIDANGNIYVGSTNAVTKFSPALVQLGTVAVPFNVYDVHVSTAGDVIACGSTGNSGTASRTGYIQSISSLTAGNTLSLICCDANICQPTNQCSTSPAFNLIAASAGGTWSGTGITNTSLGTFNPAVSGVGSFVITYSLACGVGTTTVNVSACGTVTLCINSGSITASGGTGPYTWSSTTTSVNCSGCIFPCPSLCGSTVPAWTATGTTVSAPSATVFPIKVKDVASGVTFTFTTLASIPPCTVSACPTLTLSVTSQTNVNCFGAITGIAAISTSGGVGPYTYTWSPGALSGASQTGLSAGVYTIAIKDVNLCPGTGLVTITQPTSAVSAVISATSTSGCGVSNGGATVTASGGTPAYTYNWLPSGGTTAGVSNLAVGNNTVTVTDSKGCTVTAIANISNASGPNLSVISQTNVGCFGASSGTANVAGLGGTGPYTYTWTPGNLSGASQSNLVAGTYTIIVKDANLCTGTGTLTITQPSTALTAVITATTPASCGSSSVSVFWTETFGTGCSQGALAAVYTGTNGAWAVTNTGLNDLDANEWYVSATESGMGVGVCGDGCLGAGTTNRTLHIANVSTSPAAFIFCPTGDCGAAYDTGIGSNNVTADIRAESPTINCTGQSNINITFNYLEGGQTTIDDATLWYFNGSVWAQIDNMPKTVVCGGGQGQWASRTVVLPASANNNANIKIGYRWINNDDGVGSDPSFAVDDITLSASSAGGTGGATVTPSGGTPGYTFNWIPAGGTTAGVSNLTAGNNTVTVTDAKGCTQTAIAVITSLSNQTITVNSPIICSGASAVITASGATTYSWSAGLSSTSGTTVNANPTATTIYTVTGITAGCSSIQTSTVTVVSSPTVTTSNFTICPSSSATLTASGATAYTWSPAGTLSSSTGSVVIATPVASTNYTIVGSNGTCTSSATSSVTIGAGISLISNPATFCVGTNTTLTVSGATSYTWSPAGTLSSVNGPTVIATPTISTTYTITGTTGVCSGSTTVLVTVNALPTVTVNSPTICSGASAVLTAAGATTYSWSSGLSSTSGTTVNANPSTTTIYTVTGTTVGCVGTTTSTVLVNGTPTISPSNYTTCPGGSATLTATGATSYTWSPAGTLSSTSGSVVIATPVANTNYTVIGANGTCTSSATSSVTIGTSLSITSNPTSICIGSNTVLTVSGANSYTWSPAGTLSSANGATVTATPTISTTYTITGTTGVCSGSTTLLVIVNASPTVAVNSQSLCFGTSAVLTAAGATSYSWSAGLSSTSGTTVTANPSTTTSYTVTGTTAGCVGTTTSTVTVIATPTITTGNYTICASGSATLTATGATSYTWNPAGTLSSTSGSVVIATPVANTNYTVIGASGTCTSSATSLVTISTGVTITPSSASICVGTNTLLTASGATSYTWSPVGTLSSANGATVTATPTTNTTYTINGTVGACTGSTTVLVTVNPSPTVTVNSPTICSGTSTILTASGATAYNWSAGLSSTIGTNVTANPPITTVYTVTGTTAGCSSIKTVTVYVNATPTITTSNYTTCPGGSATLTATGATSYTWSPAATLSSSSGSVVISSPVITTNYIVIGANGTCTSIATSIVTINSGLTISANSAAICIGSNTVLTVSGATNYTWSPSVTLSSANGTAVTATPTITTTYSIIGVTGSCTGSTTALVVVNNTPTITVNSPTLCSGNSTVLTASGATSYSWSTGATTQTISVTPGTTSSYTVIGTTSGCSSVSVSTIAVTTTPTLAVSPDVTIVKGSSTTLSVVGSGVSYTWSPSTTLSCATCTSPTASPIITTQYCVSSNNGACSTSTCVVVTVEPACYSNADYQTPNAFTPNGDGINDEFCLKGWAECTTTFYVAIYDRWGEKVFDASDPNFCWDGKFQGTALNTAVFVYYIKADIINVGTITKKGNITLLK